MKTEEELFAELFSGIPRLAPGGDELTGRALELVGRLPPDPSIADIGCGLGRSTLVLAEGTGASVTAVDTHQPYLDSLSGRAGALGLGGRIRTVRADMADLPFERSSLDLIWAEGAIYIIGFEEGLRSWRPYLRPGGRLAVTELSWLDPDPPGRAKAFWSAAYPAMASVEANLATLREQGFVPQGHFVLPPSSWEEEYYRPLEKRLERFAAMRGAEPAAAGIVAAVREEIETFRNSEGSYSYVFYVAQADGAA